MGKILALAVVTLTSTLALAWGDLGHQTTAEIAEQILKNEPSVRGMIQDIIGVEPLAVSATWPDHVRDDSRFNEFASYHYLTIFQNPNSKNEKDALVVLKKFPSVINSSAPKEAKAIALRYIIHVLGDIHQPLHIGNEFDRGGNFCRVSWSPNGQRSAKTINLHSAWDTNLVEWILYRLKDSQPNSNKYLGYPALAAALMSKHQRIIKSPQPVNPESWVKESNQLLLNGRVYPDTLPPQSRPYCKPDAKESDRPVLDETYIRKAAELAEERIVLGGVRLANYLKEIFAGKTPNGPMERQILDLMNIKND